MPVHISTLQSMILLRLLVLLALLALPGPLELLPGLLVLLPGLLELRVLLHYTASTAGATSATVTAGASSTSTRGACNYG